MTSKIHTIRQQYLHVEVSGTESEALALQRRLPDLYRDRLLPALERTLDCFAPPDGHLFIERVDVNVGTLSPERLEHDLPERVAQSVAESLRELASLGESMPTVVSGKVQHKTEQQPLHEAFIYFLQTGSLPWSFHLPAERSLEQVLLASWQDATKSDANLRFTNEAVLQALTSAKVRKRLIRQFSPVFLETFLFRFSPEGKRVMDGILQALRSSDVRPVEVKHFEKQLWETALALIAAGNAITQQQLVSKTWGALPVSAVQQVALASWLERHWPDLRADASIHPLSANADRKIPRAPVPSLSVEGQKETQREAPEKQQIEPHSGKTDRTIANAPQPPAVKAPIALPSFTAEEQAKPLKRVPEKHPIQHPEAGEGLYIENAGLVLFHPFLPRFFEALGIADEDNILQPDRAVCLLHYLATGRPFAPEYELILPKILCNIPLDTPVESDLELTDLEKEEAVALLEAVIRHWEVLQNTSPDGLRGTFLLRPGKVTLREDGDWLLQVEAKAFDILLDHLPWGISTIKLPWMPRLLWVEWT